MDPQQELFSKLKTMFEALGYDVYDGALPPEDTAYPFVYLGDSQSIDNNLKDFVTGNVFQTIHVYSNNVKRRGALSGMLLSLKNSCRSLRETANFSWSVKNIDQQIMPDDTTSEPLLHGVLHVEFIFS